MLIAERRDVSIFFLKKIPCFLNTVHDTYKIQYTQKAQREKKILKHLKYYFFSLISYDVLYTFRLQNQ